MDEQLLQDFLADAEELTEGLFADIASLRARQAEGRARRELLGRVFRRVHTVKGTAYAAGLAGVGGLAHEFESLLEEVRRGRTRLSAEVLDAFEDAAQALASGLASVAHRRHDEPAPPALVERLRRLARAAPASHESHAAEQPAASHGALPADILQTLSEYERQRLREATGEGARPYVVAAEFDLATFDEQFRRLGETLSERGEIISTLPGLNAGAPDRVHFRIVYASHEPPADLSPRLTPHGATLLEAQAEPGGETTNRPASSNVPTSSNVNAPLSSSSSSSFTPPARFVRVPLDALDELISSLHELFDETASALEPRTDAPGAGEAQTSADERAALTSPGALGPGVRRRFLALEEKLIGLRMSPAARTLERAARAAASAAREAGREVDFEIVGGEVSLDRSLADALADPLLHLARNAVAHGVEPAHERVAAGKPERGRVRLEASSEAGRVSLKVEDDGRGVDAEGVARAAVARGLVAPGARLTEREALRLIFRHGFSTAEELSPSAGRGVGLDAAERAVEALGGEIRVRSRAGRGSSFVIRVPTTLALLDALTVRSHGYVYCLDAKQLVETGRAAKSDAARRGGASLLRWRGGALPLVNLRALLGHEAANEEMSNEEANDAGAGDAELNDAEASDAAEGFDFVVVRAPSAAEEGFAQGLAAVVVDALGARGEVLVRGLGRHAGRWYGVSGATELRDGTAALVLDLPRLLESR